jgi:hypothetical protein
VTSRASDPERPVVGQDAEPVPGNDGASVKTPEQRKQILDRSLQTSSAQGWSVETRSEFQATVAKRKAVSYALNVFLTIITLGLWKYAFLRSGMRGEVKRHTISVDAHGNVIDQTSGSSATAAEKQTSDPAATGDPSDDRV